VSAPLQNRSRLHRVQIASTHGSLSSVDKSEEANSVIRRGSSGDMGCIRSLALLGCQKVAKKSSSGFTLFHPVASIFWF